MINLHNVVKYYKGLEHQAQALAYLQDAMPDEIMAQFASIWRSSTAKSIEAKISQRLNELNIELDAGINIVALEGCNYDFTANADEFWTDAYNDLVLICYANEAGTNFKILGKYIGTTEPGVYWTTSKNRNPKGAARVKIDYKQQSLWMIGRHRNQYPALSQIGNKVTVIRDFNKDGMRTGDKEYQGWLGINMHSGGGNGKIGRYSAGCIVIDSPSQFKQAMKLIIEYAKPISQTKFSLITLDYSKID